MALNDSAVFTAGRGYVFVGPVGTAAPTREQIRDFDPDTFGAGSQILKVTGTASNTYTLTPKVDGVGNAATAAISATATAGAVQAALEKVATIGTGNVVVKGDASKGYTIYFIGSLQNKTVTLTADATGGTAEVAEGSKPSGWEAIGHTAEEELPEFGYEGGDKETKGSWQKAALREVTTEAPVDYVTVKMIQFDESTFEYYYGKNASSEEGVFALDSGDAAAAEVAVAIVIVDGNYKIGFSAAKATTRRDEAISLANDEFSVMPIRATFIKHPGRHLFEWTTPAPAA